MCDKILLLIDLKHNEYMITVSDHTVVESDALTREEMAVELSEILYELTHVEEEENDQKRRNDSNLFDGIGVLLVNYITSLGCADVSDMEVSL